MEDTNLNSDPMNVQHEEEQLPNYEYETQTENVRPVDDDTETVNAERPDCVYPVENYREPVSAEQQAEDVNQPEEDHATTQPESVQPGDGTSSDHNQMTTESEGQ